MPFLPLNATDMKQRGWDELDIIIVSGDAYVDHHAWAAAVLGRFLEARGLRVGIIAQPDVESLQDFMMLGRPRLFFAVSPGNVDSMVSHYTSDKKKRNNDAYSPGGQAGKRPDRATIVYCNRLREAYPGVPLVIGGVEPSLRRLAHYDYWSDRVRGSILFDSRADLLVYGMGEYVLAELSRRVSAGEKPNTIRDLRGTCYGAQSPPDGSTVLPSLAAVKQKPEEFARMTGIIFRHLNPYNAGVLVQEHGSRYLVQNPPAYPLSTPELDAIYELPYQRRAHPFYARIGDIPGLEPVQFSILTHRGCFGGCAFCSLALHQGSFIQNRSPGSILREAQKMRSHPDFKGTIPDVGGPSANMYGLKKKNPQQCITCRRLSCLHPRICKNLNPDHSSSLALWRTLREERCAQNIFVASGIRHDLLLADPSREYLKELCRHHIGGQLKIAPEHINPYVTNLMHKPGKSSYLQFIREFKQVNRELGRDQYLVPYFIAAHPGCSSRDMLELAEFIRDHLQYYPEQVQNFTPTPMTLSTCMYYTGIHPLTGQNVSVPKGRKIRDKQRALLQYRNPAHYHLVREALEELKRTDLIGSGKKALIRDYRQGGKKKKRGR